MHEEVEEQARGVPAQRTQEVREGCKVGRRGARMSARFNPRRAVAPALAAVLVSCICVALAPACAQANAVAASPPLTITKFSMVATAPTREVSLGSESYEFINEPSGFTQAGGHPWGLTTTVEFASEELPQKGGSGTVLAPTRDPKDVVVGLPPGLLGDPLATPRCALAVVHGDNRCPSSTQVGVYRMRWESGKEELGPIVNVAPEAGQSAEFALENSIKITPVLTAHLVRTAQGALSFTVTSEKIPEVEISRVETTFWGVPEDPSHDAMRGLSCGTSSFGERLKGCHRFGTQAAGTTEVPFVTLPSDCAGGPETASLRADSWQEPGHVYENQRYVGYALVEATMPAVTGCALLAFNAGTGVGVQPESLLADEPVGLGVNLDVPLNEGPGTSAAPTLRDTAVTLPAGMSVSPGVVDGIQACDEFGPEGINMTGPESEEVGLDGELQLAPGHCPDASTVGEVEAITPLLPMPVKGHLYLARPGCGGAGEAPCTEEDALDGNLYRLYLEIGGAGELANEGIVFKVAFDTEANPATGQLTTNVRELLQAPYSEVRIRLNGGPRAPIDNPAVCGPATTTADFTPWSAPGVTPEGVAVAGTPDALSSSFFDVAGCSSPPAFSPGFVAGTVTPLAGRFSAFTMNLSRVDREQYVKGIQVHTPPGLLAMLSSVPLCPEAQANDPSLNGQCTASKIGTTRVASGAGSHPFEIEGNVYLTGPHDGAPFGLSIVTNAVAGPFNLGLIVVRARIDIGSTDSTATITTDETGPYAVPQIIFGVPLRLQRITVDIDRPGFMFNPTNCAAQQITASVSGNQNATATVSSPFAVGGCKSLAFKPTFKVSTSGKTSRARGASLDAKLSYPKGALGNDANIAKVKVSLPKQLPSRLTTLQQACPAATFDADPAGCPKASVVGIARASTPLLGVGLSGPVYFVSHGGEAFPSLIVVLQGEGVRVDLTGATFISKAGITSSTFRTVPDVPVDTFELYLPEGRLSALAANGNLCKQAAKLVMPSEFVAQNGAVMRQSTKIQVEGCPTKRAKAAGRRLREPGRLSRVAGEPRTGGRASR
jgi:hypothetical protein